MPPLPKKRQTREAGITPHILAWIQANWPRSALIEIKVDKGKLRPHQESALKKAAQGNIIHKMRDTGMNPADAFFLKSADALLVIYDTKTREMNIYNYRTDLWHTPVRL